MTHVNKSWLKETEDFFFRGVCASWAGGNNGVPIPEGEGALNLVGWNEVIYRDTLGFAGYQLADRWGLDPDSGKPSGSLLITHWSIPVWGMWCGGDSYHGSVIPFLREALMENYRKDKFCGGRGPARYRNHQGTFLYANEFEGGFARFSGHEYIEYICTNGDRKNLGSHRYWGGSFCYLPK